MKKKKNAHYVDNKKFLEAIIEYREKKRTSNAIDKPRIPDYIGVCIYQIATKLSNKPCFSSYSFKDEMIGDAIENCILYFDRYDPDRGLNPFAYFTTVIYYAFLRRIQKEEKNRYVMYKSFYDVFGNDSLKDENIQIKSYENIEIFIEKFESKERKRKKKISDNKLIGLEKCYAETKKSGNDASANTELDSIVA